MSALGKVEMGPGEEKIDTWTILYEPPKGGRLNGKLLVTTQRLLYDAQFDVSAKGLGPVKEQSLHSAHRRIPPGRVVPPQRPTP